MNARNERSLKSQNMPWLIGLASADLILLVLFVAPEVVSSATTSLLVAYRLGSAVLIPVLVILVVNVLPSSVKAMLVYWRRFGWLPGSEAFTRYGPSDLRVDMDALRKNVGAWSEEPKEQNAKWFKLYKLVETVTEVAATQKDFLLYRDMAVLSLLLVGPTVAALLLWGAHVAAVWTAAAILLVQYLLTAVSARHAGERFVCNVLALHSARKITAQKSPAVIG